MFDLCDIQNYIEFVVHLNTSHYQIPSRVHVPHHPPSPPAAGMCAASGVPVRPPQHGEDDGAESGAGRVPRATRRRQLRRVLHAGATLPAGATSAVR